MTERWTEWESKVLGNFLDGEHVIRLPAKWKKREVLLRWLIEAFEFGKEYPECEVNRILKEHHPDAATIRREFVVHGFMNRERSVYRRAALPDSEAAG